MKAIFLEEINGRYVQVDQREIPPDVEFYRLAFTKSGITEKQSEECTVSFKEKTYRLVTLPLGKFPAIFILESIKEHSSQVEVVY